MAVGKKLMADESSTPQVPGSLSLPNPASLGARNGVYHQNGNVRFSREHEVLRV